MNTSGQQKFSPNEILHTPLSVNPGKYLLEIKGSSCLTSNLSAFDLGLQTLEITLLKEIFLSYESPYKIPFITSIDNFTLYRIAHMMIHVVQRSIAQRVLCKVYMHIITY